MRISVIIEYTTLLIACLVMEIRSAKHKCYVCGEQDNILPFTEDKEIPKSCDKIDDIKHPKTNPYIFECPTGYNGCITKIHTSILSKNSKSCIDVSIDNCQIANGVHVCICKESLCNKRNEDENLLLRTVNRSMIATEDKYDNFDDEDYSEGGSGEVTKPTFRTDEIIPNTNLRNVINTSMNVPSISHSVSYNLSNTLTIIFAFKTFVYVNYIF